MSRVLIVEDHPRMAQTVATALRAQGIACDTVATLGHAAAFLETTCYDALILDRGLPDGDGLSLLAQLRALRQSTPCLILTARDALDDRVNGLETGADDYLTKPFDIEEMAARLKALVRRAYGVSEMNCAMLRIDTASGAVFRGHTPLEVSAREFALLKTLLARPGQAMAKDDLHRAVFGDDVVGPDAVEVLVHRLRKRIQGSGAQLVTLRGVGYLIIDESLGTAA
jgi:two-component system response regulator TctD